MSTIVFIIFFAGIDLTVNQWTQIDSKCFYFSNKNVSKTDASQMCQKHGSSLYAIKDESELKSLEPFLDQNTKYWTGLSLRNKTYMWEDGRTCCPLNWWGNGDLDKDASCGLLKKESSGWLLFDRDCDSQYGFICMKDADITWMLVSKLNNSTDDMCGVEIMPNCDGQACKDVCASHSNCDAYTLMANLCVSMKNVSQTNGCVVKLRSNLEIYRLEKSCTSNPDTAKS